MRKKISEKNVLPTDNWIEEYLKIEFLFSENQCIGNFNSFGRRNSPKYTFEQYLNDLAFTSWNLRGTAISFYNMRDELGLSKDQIKSDFNIDIFIDFIELMLNCTFRIKTTIDNHLGNIYLENGNLLDIMIDNCKEILYTLNYDLNFEKDTKEIYVYSKNEIASAVSIANVDIAESINEYRRHDIKGDLKRKGEILCTLYKKLESIEKKLKRTTYEKLISDTTFLFNKTGIRHWVEEDKIASETFLKMSLDLQEQWYDKTYNLFLSCMVISSYLDTKQEIELIKKQIKES